MLLRIMPTSRLQAADLPLVIDHFRYFAGVIRAEEGSASEIDVSLGGEGRGGSVVAIRRRARLPSTPP